MKHFVNGFLGVSGSVIAFLFGGWTQSLAVLVIFMGIDYLTGLLTAVVGRSEKTETGGLSSAVGFKGLARKVLVLLFVLIGAQLDRLLGSTFVKDAICISYILNELLSIIENAGVLGVPIPAVIRKVIDLLNKKADSNNDDQQSGYDI